MLNSLKKITGRVNARFNKVIHYLDFTDYMMLAGGVSVFYGLYLIYHPAAFIALGSGLIFWALQIERGKNGKVSK